MYKVRFHLGAGPNNMTWRVENLETGDVQFLNPSNVNLTMENCRLVNQVAAAKDIHSGANKRPCAWIICEKLAIESTPNEVDGLCGILYNPKVRPYWTWTKLEGENIDRARFSKLVTFQKKLFLHSWQ